ncbi:MAG: APC family permease, partial [Chloroflexi bacterium]|nr:APC family permease [Chloroflexota bacterium]
LGQRSTVPSAVALAPASQALTLFLILRAFASGCTALTGIEAVANGVPIFKAPEADNAGKTLIWMAGILATVFLGLTFLTNWHHLIPVEGETVVSQLARQVFGHTPFYYLVQAATALILLLAANTSFTGFPRLAMWMARDRFLPRQLANLGDRLVFANGIVVLGLLASALVVVFRASTHSLIPLYAVGVFISFTLSQAGMVRRWLRTRAAGWRHSAALNTAGAATTGVIMLVMAVTKFTRGAWIVLLLIPALVYGFLSIFRHYQSLGAQLSLDQEWPEPVRSHAIILPISGLHRGVVKSLRYAQVLGGDLHVVTVDLDPNETAALLERWRKYMPSVEVTVLPSPYRSVLGPLVEYIDSFLARDDHYVTVVVSEFVPARWWHNLLHNQTAWSLQLALLYSRRAWMGRCRVITAVPFYLKR